MSLGGNWLISAATSTTAVQLVALEAPTNLAAPLTSDPPEDLTLLRIVGEFEVSLAAAGGKWVLALLVQDSTWTPSALFGTDADKRILWSEDFHSWASGATTYRPGTVTIIDGAGNEHLAGTLKTRIDISPKVKVEAGKALYLVAYEQSGATTFTTGTNNIRMLFQRSGR